MEKIFKQFFANRTAVIATMHHKEKVIAPLLERELGVKTIVTKQLDTDAFGTFTMEVERPGNQLEAARKKLAEALRQTNTTLGVASEGSFGSHPVFPLAPYNRELMLFLDREMDIEVTGYVANSNTNYSQKEIRSYEEAMEFALAIGFPEHAVILKRVRNTSNEEVELVKGITTESDLANAMIDLQRSNRNVTSISDCTLVIETDMRAMYNPTRMKNIKLATEDLLEKLKSVCPKCDTPGFSLHDVKKGLPCEWCHMPTNATLAHVYQCQKCTYVEEKQRPDGMNYADPAHCNFCNP
ncbi:MULTISPECIES: DUF6671 family protein [Bacillaceae]|uniref:DUF6671 domain-containing protein n=1 Tax=Evansella alkalicola TaxID=745819 RepID=A0ABS6JWL6_9BACI|nr:MULTISPECIES: DUF6671 family protein [Bacillaceae]MBU9722983.1 hypothetical protein [Bacillus alkalicola]